MNTIKCPLILAFCFTMAYSFSQSPESIKIEIDGIVLSKSDSVAIPYAHIVQIYKKRGAVCNENGNFHIHPEISDTLLITAVGFKDTKIPVEWLTQASNQKPRIFLEQEIYSLEEIVIVPYKNYKELKQAILTYEPPDAPHLDLNLPDLPKSTYSNQDGLVPIISMSPITALYNKFSREGKEMMEYCELIERKKIEAQVMKKYNVDIVRHITGIENERDVLDFMEYCNLSDEFILSSNDYTIYLAINNCYKAFKNM